MTRIGMLLVAIGVGWSTPVLAEPIEGTLFKQQECECCEAHADYLRKNGFGLKIESVKNLSQMSIDSGVPPGFQGCHIIKIDGYVFEGHLTNEIIRRFLAEKPKDAIGLTLPGMPASVPGMGGTRDEPVTVYLIAKDGSTSSYATQ